ncbi:tRNA (guanosine(46)-N7)-methyltransferase TrmB [Sansalvadorimonas verongulae]|uniref:tRNA (guanosine(46)-N7)-methyltransferase TrmB n=1 Tax=Sansalvadorimonas verongulae TaxID=2172824 RepID=UPI0012BB6687|nr:tRNA (guanosine(46)-N7)-methyltransferase TrmB [Sansalvadorimonas verongulae]MTI15308.1 tRNA (guanosine(46)-N7)-methyltransferase TrmB [Sansalvadorimonas verongulae]
MTETDISSNDQAQTPHPRKIKSFVLRAGRMTTGQQKGWDVIFPKQGLKLEDGLLNLDGVFGRKAPLVLEIGFGMGLSLVEMAGNEQDKNFIGIEVHRPGVGSLMNEADKAGLRNLRAYCDDAVEVLAKCIPNSSIDRLQVYFPDPWHKKRHNKRRLIQPGFVASLLPKLKTGGVLHLATDWENYAEQMMEVMNAAEGWRNQAGENNYSPRPDYRPITKFEKRGERLGHGVWDLLFEKI